VLSALGRRGAAKEQQQGDGGEREDHHQLEIVDVADDRSLFMDDSIERRASRRGLGAQGAVGVLRKLAMCAMIA
jgi:hypothetical protein